MSTSNALICVLTVDLGDGRSAPVHIYARDDDASLLARGFMREHGLDVADAGLLGALTEHIATNAAEARQRFAEQLAARATRKAARAAQQTQPLPPAEPPQPPQLPPPQPQLPRSRLSSPTGSASLAAAALAARRLAGSDAELEARYEAIANNAASLSMPPHSRRSIAATAAARLSTSASRPPDAAPDAEVEAQWGGAPAPPKLPPHAAATKGGRAASVAAPLNAARRASRASSAAPPPAPPAAAANPALFARLHLDAKDKAQRAAQLAAQVAKIDREAYLRERRKYRPHERAQDKAGPGAGPQRAEDRLYEQAREAAARREAGLAAQRALLAEQSEGAWACAVCGARNAASASSCAQPLKFGTAVAPPSASAPAASAVRVCGALRPAAPHQPVLSAFARNLGAPAPAEAPTAATLGVEHYRRERAARESQLAAREAAELAAQPFRPQITQRSSELAEAARRRRLQALALASSTTLSSASSEAAPHELLFADARQRQASRTAAALSTRPSSWEGCTFQPDIGASNGGGFAPDEGDEDDDAEDEEVGEGAAAPCSRRHARPEAELQAFFDRMHSQAAAARARAEASRRRAEQVRQAMLWRRHPGGDAAQGQARDDGGLLDHARDAAAHKAAAVAAARATADAAARGRHALRRSEQLLEARRQRCFAATFLRLCESVLLTPAQRSQEQLAQSAFERTVGGGQGSAGPQGFLPQPQTPQQALLSGDDLAAVLVALDLDDEGSIGEGPGQAVAAAHLSALDIDACWPACLAQPQLARLAEAALARLRLRLAAEQGQSPAPASMQRAEAEDEEADENADEDANASRVMQMGFDAFVTHEPPSTAAAFELVPPPRAQQEPRLVLFSEFCAAAGRLLEEAGGGPHVYLLARRHAKQQAAQRAAHAAEAAAQAAAAPFAPQLNARSLQIVEKARLREAAQAQRQLRHQQLAGDGGAEPLPPLPPPPQLVGERLQQQAGAYRQQRLGRELDDLRNHLAAHPFRPQPLQPLHPPSQREGLVRLAKDIVTAAQRAPPQVPVSAVPPPLAEAVPWLPRAVTDAAERKAHATSRAMCIDGGALKATPRPASRQASPALPVSQPPSQRTSAPSPLSPRPGPREAEEPSGEERDATANHSQPSLARTFIGSIGLFARRDADAAAAAASTAAVAAAAVAGAADVSRLSNGGFLLSPARFLEHDDFGYTPARPLTDHNGRSLEALVLDGGELDKSALALQRLSSMSLEALNARIERILGGERRA